MTESPRPRGTGPSDPDGHVADDLPALLTGDADAATVQRASRHLRACPDCRDALVDLVAAHAALSSAAHFAPDVATGGRLSAPTPPPALAAGAAAPAADLSAVFAQIRAEAEAASVAAAHDGTADDHAPVDELAARRRRRGRRALLAAAAVVVIGGGTAVAVSTLGGDSGRSMTVSAFGSGSVDASAQVGEGWMKLNASSLPSLPAGQFYEAWLVRSNPSGVVALGPLGSDRTATYSVPQSVMSQYGVLQVTIQQDNGSPMPSGTSVLRATL